MSRPASMAHFFQIVASKSPEEQVMLLRDMQTPAMVQFLKAIIDPSIVWLVSPGVRYEPCCWEGEASNAWESLNRLYLFTARKTEIPLRHDKLQINSLFSNFLSEHQYIRNATTKNLELATGLSVSTVLQAFPQLAHEKIAAESKMEQRHRVQQNIQDEIHRMQAQHRAATEAVEHLTERLHREEDHRNMLRRELDRLLTNLSQT
jgi:hypothetical protein